MVGCSRFLPLLGQNKGIAIFSRRGIILLSSRALYSIGNGSPHREGIYLSPPGMPGAKRIVSPMGERQQEE